jgi:hypothetical protein
LLAKLSQHETDGGKFQEREGVAVEILPVLGETKTTIEPSDRDPSGTIIRWPSLMSCGTFSTVAGAGLSDGLATILYPTAPTPAPIRKSASITPRRCGVGADWALSLADGASICMIQPLFFTLMS